MRKALVLVMACTAVLLTACGSSTARVAPHRTATAQVTPPLSFETGMVFPRWSSSGYGIQDGYYASELTTIARGTHARWLEMPILFTMHAPDALTLDASQTPTVANVGRGITIAHHDGYHVFLVPLVTVSVPGGWAGSVHFQTHADEGAWFDAFWQAYKPYIDAAQRQHVEQVSIGTELAWLQRHGSDHLWEHYIAQVRRHYTGRLTYDTNWPDMSEPLRPWMRQLDTLGVSEYMPLTDRRQRIAPTAMTALFQSLVIPKLDAFSEKVGKPVILSEIGYRKSADALFHTWESSNHGPIDLQEQAAAIQAALQCLLPDPHIQGTFLWGWHDTGPFDLEQAPAADVINSIYSTH